MKTLDTLNIYAYDWSLAESYGRVARELADGLEALGCYVNRIGPNAPQKPIRLALGGIVLGYPTLMPQLGAMFSAGPKVAITAFESTALPLAWADLLNMVDQVIVPSEWLVDVFKNEGVEAPITCIPQGISKTFAYVERQREPDGRYTFLAIADRGRRKAWDAAGFAFFRAFGDDPNYHLIFKSRLGGLSIPLANPNMSLISEDYDDAGMAALYAQADCMIFPGREGFGLPPREFAATGGTSIALNWGGTADHLTQWGLPIATAGMESAWKNDSKHQGVGQWAIPDIDDLAATMKHVAKHRDYYRARGKATSAFVHQTYDWSMYASRVYATWKEARAAYDKRNQRQAV